MRLNSAVLLPLAVLSACSEYEVEGDRDVFGVPNPPELGAPVQQDRVLQTTVQAVDVLWVVDTSCSMAQEQEQLAANFEPFMTHFLESGLDYHIGVVTTNMDDTTIGAGRLVLGGADGTLKYIDNLTPDPIHAFETLVVLGTDGHSTERGRDAVHAALDPEGDLLNGHNAGFYRDNANLAVVVISDEDDYSWDLDVGAFEAWFTGLKESPELVSFSSIVGPDGSGSDGACDLVEAGSDYLAVTRAVGGIEWSICSDDWASALQELGVEAAGLRREFFLSAQPIPETIEAWIEVDSTVLRELAYETDFTYNRSRNSIFLTDYTPRAQAEVFIEYEVLAEEAFVPDYAEDDE